MACCTSIPNTKALRTTCSIACTCMSPPGQPITSSEPSSRTAIAGFGVRRGRRPGPSPTGGAGRVATAARARTHDPEARDDGAAYEPSEGTAEKARSSASRRTRTTCRGRTSKVPRASAAGGSAGRRPPDRRHPRRRARSVDGGEAGVGVRRGQELVQADVSEGRVAVAVLAVGEGALEHLQHEVHVARVVERRRLEAGALEGHERLGEHGSLAPRAARQHVEVAPARADDGLVAGAEQPGPRASGSRRSRPGARRSGARCRRRRTPRAPLPDRPRSAPGRAALLVGHVRIVAARSRCTKRSPTCGGRPPGRKSAAFPGQRA